MSTYDLRALLINACIEHLYQSFIDNGIDTPEKLSRLERYQYQRLGIYSEKDKETLNSLIKILREEIVLEEHEGDDYLFTEADIGMNNVDSHEHVGLAQSENDMDYTMVMQQTNVGYMEDSGESQEWEGLNEGEDMEEVVRLGTDDKYALVNAYGVSTKISPQKGTRVDAQRPRGLTEIKTSRVAKSGNRNKITVCVRKRPLSKDELVRAEKDVIEITNRQLVVHEMKKKVDLTRYIEKHVFRFDEVYGEKTNNEQVYQSVVERLVNHAFSGANATCIAYGQTGSGKTYTMLDRDVGLYKLAGEEMFIRLSEGGGDDGYVILVEFCEIYLNEVYDLLNNRKKLNVREAGDRSVCIQDIQQVQISSTQELVEVFEYGNQHRKKGATNANKESSRSHAILQLLVCKKVKKGRVMVDEVVGKLSFVDLAGNERGADRGDAASKDDLARREGAEINKSLLALKECIRAMDMGKSHQPFRQSKLTLVLRDSFIGNSNCVVIATISPNSSNTEHTLNTLRYADRIKALGPGGSDGSSSSGSGTLVDDGHTYDHNTKYEHEGINENEKKVNNSISAGRNVLRKPNRRSTIGGGLADAQVRPTPLRNHVNFANKQFFTNKTGMAMADNKGQLEARSDRIRSRITPNSAINGTNIRGEKRSGEEAVAMGMGSQGIQNSRTLSSVSKAGDLIKSNVGRDGEGGGRGIARSRPGTRTGTGSLAINTTALPISKGSMSANRLRTPTRAAERNVRMETMSPARKSVMRNSSKSVSSGSNFGTNNRSNNNNNNNNSGSGSGGNNGSSSNGFIGSISGDENKQQTGTSTILKKDYEMQDMRMNARERELKIDQTMKQFIERHKTHLQFLKNAYKEESLLIKQYTQKLEMAGNEEDNENGNKGEGEGAEEMASGYLAHLDMILIAFQENIQKTRQEIMQVVSEHGL